LSILRLIPNPPGRHSSSGFASNFRGTDCWALAPEAADAGDPRPATFAMNLPEPDELASQPGDSSKEADQIIEEEAVVACTSG